MPPQRRVWLSIRSRFAHAQVSVWQKRVAGHHSKWRSLEHDQHETGRTQDVELFRSDQHDTLHRQGHQQLSWRLDESRQRNGYVLLFRNESAQCQIVLHCRLFITGMTIGQCSFLRHVYAPDLEKTMIMAKQKYPQLQIIFVVIQKRGDPAYGKSNSVPVFKIIVYHVWIELKKN